MRFYKNRQAEMLMKITVFLRDNEQILAKKVPALRDFIREFLAKKKILDELISKNKNAVSLQTLEKKSVKTAFVDATVKMISVLRAAGYRYKEKPLPEMKYSRWDLMKMSSDKLCKSHLNIYAAIKKIKTLQYYGFSPEELQDMQAYYKEFTSIKNAPAVKKKETKATHKVLDKLINDCVVFLKDRIDPLIPIAAADDWRLKSDYQSLRQVLTRGQGRPSDAEVGYRKSRERKKKDPGEKSGEVAE